jgi:release factor glutamine methyltransferase
MPELAMSLGQLIRGAASQLQAGQIPEARRQALHIWGELNGGTIGEALLTPQSEVEVERAAQFQHAIQRRAAGEPLCHVTGSAGFRHLTLRSDRRALIPRPETEGLVELLLARVRTGVVADIGTGSGCIALSLASEGDFQQVLAVDCSAEALDLARLNYELSRVPRVVHLVQADLATPFAPGSLDALISNPPYLTLDEYGALDASVRRWEPELALVSGPDGLQSTRRLLEEGWPVLRPGGWMALEIDCTRATVVAQLAAGMGWNNVRVQLDLFGRERYLLAQRSNTR